MKKECTLQFYAPQNHIDRYLNKIMSNGINYMIARLEKEKEKYSQKRCCNE